MSFAAPSGVLSADVYHFGTDYLSSTRYRTIDLYHLNVRMISPLDKVLHAPKWLRELGKQLAFTRTDEGGQTEDQIRQLHAHIVDAATADDKDIMNLIYDRILAGIRLQHNVGRPWENTKIRAEMQFSLDSVLKHPAGGDQPYVMAVPKPAITVGYGDITFRDTPMPHDSDIQRTLTVNNENSLWTPYLLVETTRDSNLYASINRLLGGASSSINLNKRVMAEQNAVFGICLQSSTANLYATWFDSGYYTTRLVKSFALTEYSQFLQLRRYVHNIIGWGSNRRLQIIKGALNNGSPPQPTISPSSALPASMMARSMPLSALT
ncbi:hypothetical protein ABKA04_010244 [Annulohypoxylon sp. FPYF3050]